MNARQVALNSFIICYYEFFPLLDFLGCNFCRRILRTLGFSWIFFSTIDLHDLELCSGLEKKWWKMWKIFDSNFFASFGEINFTELKFIDFIKFFSVVAFTFFFFTFFLVSCWFLFFYFVVCVFFSIIFFFFRIVWRQTRFLEGPPMFSALDEAHTRVKASRCVSLSFRLVRLFYELVRIILFDFRNLFFSKFSSVEMEHSPAPNSASKKVEKNEDFLCRTNSIFFFPKNWKFIRKLEFFFFFFFQIQFGGDEKFRIEKSGKKN